MFVKPRSSKCLTKRSLDITSFSGCERLSRSAISCSSEPAFTPIRIAHPAAPAASITASTLAQSPMLPGLMRSLAAPASTAPMASLWLKWISATIGTGDSAQMVRKPSSAARWAHSRARYRNRLAPTRALAQALPGHQRYRCRSWIGPPPARRHRSARRPHARGASARAAKDGIKTIQTLPYRINRRMSERSM